MKTKFFRLLGVAFAALFYCLPAIAQNAGTVTNGAFAIGLGAGKQGYASLLCASTQLAVGQSAAAPICRTLTGDVTLNAAGVTAIGAGKVTASMIAAMTSAQLAGIISDETGSGGLAVFNLSPTFAGVPLSPTAAFGTNTTQIATTAFVQSAVIASVSGVASFNTRTGAVVPVTGDYTATMVPYAAPGTGGQTRSVAANIADRISAANFDTVQHAFDYAASVGKAVWFPCGTYDVSAAPVNMHAVSFDGAGQCVQITSTANATMLYASIADQQIYYTHYKNVALVSSNTTHTSVNGIEIRGDASGTTAAYLLFDGIQCGGVNVCIHSTVLTPANTHQWHINGLIAYNNGALSTETPILMDHGFGTGSSITNAHMVIGNSGGACINIGGGASDDVGDFVIANNQCNGGPSAVGIQLSSTARYKSNITIANNNWGDLFTMIIADGYSLRMSNNGGTAMALTNTRASSGDFSYDQYERRLSVSHPTISSTTADNFLTVGIPASFGGVTVEVSGTGKISSVGGQIRTSRFHIVQNNSCASITITQIDTFWNGTGTPFTFGTSLAGCVVTFGAGLPAGTTSGSALSYTIRVMGGGISAYDANIL